MFWTRAAVLAIALLVTRPAAASPSEWWALLDRYAHKEYDGVSARIAALPPKASSLRSFQADATQWIDAAGPDAARARSLVAATLALEIAHRTNGESDAVRERLIVWACATVRQHAAPVPTEAERRWYLASLAGLEEMGTWSILSGASPFPAEAALLKEEGPAGHIVHLRQRFPDEPRFRLAAVEILDVNATTLSARTWTFKYDEACSAARDDIAQMSVAPAPSEAALSDLWRLARDSARSQRAFMDTVLPRLSAQYQELAPDETLRVEATLRAGYVRMRLCDWPEAKQAFAEVIGMTKDPFWTYLGLFLTGWVLEREGDRQAAIRGYDAALLVVPNAWSGSLRLAAQLLLSERPGDRERAYIVMGAAGAEHIPDDPWRVFRNGDARLWPIYMDRLRAVLE